MNPLRSNGKFKAYDSPLEHLMAYTEINPETGCYEWQGAVDKDGYGKICTNHRTLRPHRLAYGIAHNVELQPNQQLNHKCHNRRCWNPEHVYIGTQQQNIADRDRDGCPTAGENHPRAKLTPETVMEIKALRKEGLSVTLLAKLAGVSTASISAILTGRTWKHLNDPN